AQALVYENEVFELLADARTSIADVLADQTDYRNLLRQADHADTARITHLTNRHALRALAKPVDRQLNIAFSALFEE
ncbi:MAG: plasmid stability protein StbB, partial [Burkholderiales bacterium 34-67-9]